MLEKEIVLTLSDMELLRHALVVSQYRVLRFSAEHIKHLIDLITKISSNYTADRTVKLMVFKEPLLR